ncbi:MAG: threonylcarbamoyl-AMP synthase [Coriobacteriales bacterium]|jgi:L-threonylcarbamoyladenylate synthase|nr:threonylcarbamoyl-AMP synthase [Coriobacteriales bacterium]
MTLLLKTDPTHPDPLIIEQAAALLAAGGLALFPTDTVYGLGLAALPGASLQPLYDAKQRPAEKSIPLLIAEPAELQQWAQNLPDYALRLAERHWPGALTLVVEAAPGVPADLRAADGSIAIRCSASPLVRALIRSVGVPLATTSANLSGQSAATSARQIAPRLAAHAEVLIDGGVAAETSHSTIVSCIHAQPTLLREGAIEWQGLEWQ